MSHMTLVIGTCRGKKKQTKTNSIKLGRWGIWDKYMYFHFCCEQLTNKVQYDSTDFFKSVILFESIKSQQFFQSKNRNIN